MGGPISGHIRERGKGGGQKGPDKFNRPAAATLTRYPHSSPAPCILSSHSKPTTNPISAAPTLSGPPNSPPPTVDGLQCHPPSPLGQCLMPGEKLSSQTEGNHVGSGLGGKAVNEDKRTQNLRTLGEESTNRGTVGPRSSGEAQQGPRPLNWWWSWCNEAMKVERMRLRSERG